MQVYEIQSVNLEVYVIEVDILSRSCKHSTLIEASRVTLHLASGVDMTGDIDLSSKLI